MICEDLRIICADGRTLYIFHDTIPSISPTAAAEIDKTDSVFKETILNNDDDDHHGGIKTRKFEFLAKNFQIFDKN